MSTELTVYSGPKKAAILLLALGDQASAELLRKLEEKEIQALSREISRLDTASAEHVHSIAQEFWELIAGSASSVRGGPESARKVLLAAFGPDKANRAEFLPDALENEEFDFGTLYKADPQQFAKSIQNEHPQTIALIATHLSAPQASELLVQLPAAIRAQVARRMARPNQADPAVVEKIAGVIGRRVRTVGESSRASHGGVREVAEVLNRLDSTISQTILAELEQQDTALAESIRNLMFVFEDILKVDATGMKSLLGKLDRKLLTLALKGTSENLRKHFLQFMSQRGAEMLKEDMEALGPVRIRDVEGAQQQIIALVKQLQAEGQIALGGGGDQYVV